MRERRCQALCASTCLRMLCAMCRDVEGVDPFRWGTLVGSAMGGMAAFTGGCTSILTSYKKMNPFCIPFAITNMGSAMLAMDTGLMGPNYSISTACATGNYCMLNAYNHIQNGDADLMLAGATDAAVIPTGRRRVHRVQGAEPAQRGARGRVAAHGTATATASSWARARAC